MSHARHALGSRIRRARRLASLSQAQLAAKVGVQRSAVTHWESGDTAPTCDRLAMVAIACDVHFEWLATGRGAVAYQHPLLSGALRLDEFAQDQLEEDVLAALRTMGHRQRRALLDFLDAMLDARTPARGLVLHDADDGDDSVALRTTTR